MPDNTAPIAVEAASVPKRPPMLTFPEPFASLMAGRERRGLGDVFGLTRYGVNLTRLPPGGISAIRHFHTEQDEFVYILEGTPVLITDAGETPLSPGMCAGFKAGSGNGHHLVNRGTADVLYLEVGDRTPGDTAIYPDDDVALARSAEGRWTVVHKNGLPY
jgi:uncharacterized cupin superfamily protein